MRKAAPASLPRRHGRRRSPAAVPRHLPVAPAAAQDLTTSCLHLMCLLSSLLTISVRFPIQTAMRRSVAEVRGAPVRELTPAGPAAAVVLVDGVPVLDEDLEAEEAGEAEDPTAKKHPKRPASAWPAALRGPGNCTRRVRLAAAAAVLSALLLVLWAAQPAGTLLQPGGGGMPRRGTIGGSGKQDMDTQPFRLPFSGAVQPKPRSLPFEGSRQQAGEAQQGSLSHWKQQHAAQLQLGQPSAGAKQGALAELLVEFTAPGLSIPLR